MWSDEFDILIADASEKHSVPFTWIKAIIGAESDFNPEAYREEPQIDDASRGLMQLLLSTARGLGFTGDPSALFDPLINIDLGTKLLAQLRRSWGTSFDRVYSAYNSGGPDKYLTSSSVRAHLERARSYLQMAEASVTTVNGSSEPVPEGSAAVDYVALLGVAALAIWYFFFRR